MKQQMNTRKRKQNDASVSFIVKRRREADLLENDKKI